MHGDADGIEAPFYLNTAGHPVVLDEIVLAAALLEGSPKAKLDTYRGSMHRFFETWFGVRMLNAQEKPDVKRGSRCPGRW